MAHMPVLVFETDPENSRAFDNALTYAGIKHASHLIRLRKKHAPPPIEHFQAVLNQYHPRLLITSWEIIGSIVKVVSLQMPSPKPEAKWIISSYNLQKLQELGALSWADEVYEKPISLELLTGQIGRHLASLSLRSSIIVPA